MVMDRLAGEVSPERVVEMLEAGAEPLQDLIAALHTKRWSPSSSATAPAAPSGDQSRSSARPCSCETIGS